MSFFYDIEFIEDGTTIDLVPIGVVDETGREFYAVSTEFDNPLPITIREGWRARSPGPTAVREMVGWSRLRPRALAGLGACRHCRQPSRGYPSVGQAAASRAPSEGTHDGLEPHPLARRAG